MKHTIKFANWLNKWNNLNNIISICLFTIFFVIIFVFILSLKRKNLIRPPKRLTNYLMRRKKSSTKGELLYEPHHNWHHSDMFAKPTFCNVCESGMMVSGGLCCTYCNVYTDEKCLKQAEKKFKCKKLVNLKSNASDEVQENMDTNPLYKTIISKWPHHWIKGNLKLNSTCSICNEVFCLYLSLLKK